MSDTTSQRLVGILEHMASGLRSQFDAARGAYSHRGIVGAEAEEVLRGFLRDILPPQFFTGTGQIVDLQQGMSKQADVVIADNEHPILFRQQTNQLFFCESVYAVIEAKSSLDSSELRSGVQNIASYKQLPRESLPVSALVQKGGHVMVLPPELGGFSQVRVARGANPKFGAIFAFDSNTSSETLLDTFCRENAALLPEHRTDSVCILNRGLIVPVTRVRPAISVLTYSEKHTGWAFLEEPKRALAFFYMHLMQHLMHTQLLAPDVSRLMILEFDQTSGRAVAPPGIDLFGDSADPVD